MDVTITLSSEDWQKISAGLDFAANRLTGSVKAEIRDYADTLSSLAFLAVHRAMPGTDSHKLHGGQLSSLCDCTECARSPNPCDWVGGL